MRVLSARWGVETKPPLVYGIYPRLIKNHLAEAGTFLFVGWRKWGVVADGAVRGRRVFHTIQSKTRRTPWTRQTNDGLGN